MVQMGGMVVVSLAATSFKLSCVVGGGAHSIERLKKSGGMFHENGSPILNLKRNFEFYFLVFLLHDRLKKKKKKKKKKKRTN